MKKTVIAVCAFGLAAVAAQAQGVARDFNEFGRMYGNSEQGRRITGTLEKANQRAAGEHAREQQGQQPQSSQPHYFVPATGAMKDWAVFGNLYAPEVSAAAGNQSGAQAAPAQPKAKAKPAGKEGNGKGNTSGKPAASAKPKAKQKQTPSVPARVVMDEHTWRHFIRAH